MKTQASLTVSHPGFFSLIQDGGRKGYQAFGVPESGAMDKEAAMIASLLAGNPKEAPVIEVTVMGLELEVHEDLTIAITGGDLGPQVDGMPVPMYQTVKIQTGSRLRFTGLRTGARAYLAFSGTMKADNVMGSYATYTRGNFGGLDGRKLEKGDSIVIEPKETTFKRFDASVLPGYGQTEIRVILFREDEAFTGEGIHTFLSEPYDISNQSDRMGYRLSGPLISHREGADMISSAITFGAIQVPGHGQPIIMMADRQTVGGYTQIGRVISADLSVLAQSLPGKTLTFKEVSLREAQNLYRQRMNQINKAFSVYE